MIQILILFFASWVLLGAFIGIGLIFANLIFSKGNRSSKKNTLLKNLLRNFLLRDPL